MACTGPRHIDKHANENASKEERFILSMASEGKEKGSGAEKRRGPNFVQGKRAGFEKSLTLHGVPPAGFMQLYQSVVYIFVLLLFQSNHTTNVHN